ncbi:hypothetical protein CUR178_07330 [Leishmania enriettii]|uniref:DhaK domain-containing protein n=1 Tax=Leishmania enriettii TaxID=5663 RepID=A0A836KRH6_LEIEN|nr:hypothetical protein CUR178_07330 [Leishmania enriettii]
MFEMTAVVPKCIDEATSVMEVALDAVCEMSSGVKKIERTAVIVASCVDSTKVLLLCGGGSVHEPAHAGLVARGWQRGAVCGSVFGSPPTAHVSAGIDSLANLQGPNGPGILVIITNCTCNILSFEYAVLQARARGIQVETALAADDAFFGTEYAKNCRGFAGCCLLHKILGAAAASVLSLAQLKELFDRVSRNMRSIGASLSSCLLPGSPASSVLPPGTVDVGLGLHGEISLLQIPFEGAAPLTHLLVGIPMGKGEVPVRGKTTAINAGSIALLLVNNLGSTTDLEMSILSYHALRKCATAHATIVGVHSERHMTLLDMHSFSLTLLVVEDEADLKDVLNTDALQGPLMKFHSPQLPGLTVPGPLTALQLARREAEAAGRVVAAPTTSPLCTASSRSSCRLRLISTGLTRMCAMVTSVAACSARRLRCWKRCLTFCGRPTCGAPSHISLNPLPTPLPAPRARFTARCFSAAATARRWRSRAAAQWRPCAWRPHRTVSMCRSSVARAPVTAPWWTY